MYCICGAPLEGDGYTIVLHCSNTTDDLCVAPIYCSFEGTEDADKDS